MVNPVIATVPCKDCDQVATVQQVARGKGKRLMFYTRCPDCGCDQRTGKTIQEYIFNNSSPRSGYESIFDGQIPPGIKFKQDQIDENQENNNINSLKPDIDQKTGSKAGLVALGLIVTGVLAVVGLKK
jgi:hypothetical protein